MTALRSLMLNVFVFGFTGAAALVLWVGLLGSRRFMQRILRVWVRCLKWATRVLVGLDVEVRGRENIPDGAAVIACKHQSAWETIIFYALVDDPSYVLKKELLRIPLWGWFGRKCGAIAVDRAGGAGALKKLVGDCQAALARGSQIIIFPEGTRMAPGQTRPYHPGIAAVYANVSAPVVPAALNSGTFWPRRSFVKRSGVITIEFLPAMPPGLDRRAFAAALQERIESATRRLTAEASPPFHG